MAPVEWLVDLAFGTLYGGLVTLIALAAAIPYSIWQAFRWLAARIPGGRHGNP